MLLTYTSSLQTFLVIVSTHFMAVSRMGQGAGAAGRVLLTAGQASGLAVEAAIEHLAERK